MNLSMGFYGPTAFENNRRQLVEDGVTSGWGRFAAGAGPNLVEPPKRLVGQVDL
jgi:hypothetical protein